MEANLFVQLAGLIIGEVLPERIMKPRTPARTARIPGVKVSRNIHPVKSQLVVGMIVQEALDLVPVMRMCEHPNLVVTRKMPRPVPGAAGL